MNIREAVLGHLLSDASRRSTIAGWTGPLRSCEIAQGLGAKERAVRDALARAIESGILERKELRQALGEYLFPRPWHGSVEGVYLYRVRFDVLDQMRDGRLRQAAGGAK